MLATLQALHTDIVRILNFEIVFWGPVFTGHGGFTGNVGQCIANEVLSSLKKYVKSKLKIG